ncbi:hypothetical protein F4680DRAFT_411606 [Xylaria scruposa]|nr:hypothetical protein F4680DRAFT_411606 [Xylaria scruposa]
MKLSLAYIVVFNFTAVVLSAAIDQYRDAIAVDAIQTGAPGEDTAPTTTATRQIRPSYIELPSSKSRVPFANSTDAGVEIKKGGGRGFGKGWKWGGGGHHSGASRIDSHSMVLVLAACCLCAIVASLI